MGKRKKFFNSKENSNISFSKIHKNDKRYSRMSRLFEDEFKQNKKNENEENEKFQVEEKKIESQILEKPSIEKKRIKKIIGGKRDIIVMEKKVKNSQNKEKDELKSPINKTKTLIDLCNIEDSDEEAQEKFDIFEDLKLKKIKSCEAKDSLQLIKEIISKKNSIINFSKYRKYKIIKR